MTSSGPDYHSVICNGSGVGHAGTHQPVEVLFSLMEAHGLQPWARIQKAPREPGALHFSGGFAGVDHPFSVEARGPVAIRLREAMEANRARFQVVPEEPDYTPRKRKPIPAHAEVPKGYPSGEELWGRVAEQVKAARKDLGMDARIVLGQLAVVDFYRHLGGPVLVFSVPSFWAREVAEEHLRHLFSNLLTRALNKPRVAVWVHFLQEGPWRVTDESLERDDQIRARRRASLELAAS